MDNRHFSGEQERIEVSHLAVSGVDEVIQRHGWLGQWL